MMRLRVRGVGWGETGSAAMGTPMGLGVLSPTEKCRYVAQISSPATPKARPVAIAIANASRAMPPMRPMIAAAAQPDVGRGDARDRSGGLRQHEEPDGAAQGGAQQREDRLDDPAASQPEHRTPGKADTDHGMRDPGKGLDG